MSFHKRSTNERVLARHHFKRFPAAADPAPASLNPDPADPNPGVAGQPAPRPAVTSARPVTQVSTIHPTATTPLVKVLPPVGTHGVIVPVVTGSMNTLVATYTTSPTMSHSVTSSIPPQPSSISSVSPSISVTASSSSRLSQTPVSGPSAAAPKPSDDTLAPQSSRGVPPGAIGAIVAAIILIVVGLGAFFVRKQYQRRRAMKRNTWGAGLVPSLESKRDTIYAGQPQVGQFMVPGGGIFPHERISNVPKTAEMSQTPAAATFAPRLAPPASSYNPGSPLPISPFVAPSIRAPSTRSMATGTLPANATPSADFAIVARSFIPTLPDELHIANGEQIQVMTAYDDGWALCANLRGEQGVVPLECLERTTSASASMQLHPQSEFGYDANRTSRRMSSLAPNAAGTY